MELSIQKRKGIKKMTLLQFVTIYIPILITILVYDILIELRFDVKIRIVTFLICLWILIAIYHSCYLL